MHSDLIVQSLMDMNRAFLSERMAVEPGHRRLMARARKAPHRRAFWTHTMADDVERECQYCGTLFVPDMTRRVGFVAAPTSVADAHRRCHCGPHCDRSNINGMRYARVDHKAIFERDGWRCYLCGVATPPDRRGFPYAPDRPSVDHVIPQGNGTNEPDNLRCCCRLCNLEKGNATLWCKVSMYVETGMMNLFSDVLADALPRHPTLDELIGLWRRFVICMGQPVEGAEQITLIELGEELMRASGTPEPVPS